MKSFTSLMNIIETRKNIRFYGKKCESSMDFFTKELKDLLRVISAVSRNMKVSAYLVGGIVRDALLKIPNCDIDIVVDGNGVRFGERLARRLDARIEIHKKFMTAALALKEGQQIDIATSRVEFYYKPAQLPSVESGSIKQDLSRRDFTINSLALSLNRKDYGEILDFFGGREDLKNKKIKVLHKMSFIEDPTRIFRAVRFEKRLGFRMDKHTEALARSAVEMGIVSRVSGVRIRDELIHIMSEEKPFNAIKRLQDLGALSKIGIMVRNGKDYKEDMEKALNSLCKLDQYDRGKILKWRLLMAIMLKDKTARSIELWCLKLKIRKKDMFLIKDTVTNMPKVKKALKDEFSNEYSLYNELRQYPVELLAICHSWSGGYAKNIKKYYKRLVHVKLEISGEDLKDMGYSPSPVFKKVLQRVYRMKFNKKVSGREEELIAAGILMNSYTHNSTQVRSRAR